MLDHMLEFKIQFCMEEDAARNSNNLSCIINIVVPNAWMPKMMAGALSYMIHMTGVCSVKYAIVDGHLCTTMNNIHYMSPSYATTAYVSSFLETNNAYANVSGRTSSYQYKSHTEDTDED